MKFEIKNRWTGSIIFTAEIEATEETPLSIKLGLAVKAAVKESANLYGANLYGANLDGANLYVANLDGANLDGANLYGANLYGANLDGANLYGANLYGANLYGANLYGANLYGANLDGANLYGANLDGANLYGASLWVSAGNSRHVKSVQTGIYAVAYSATHMQIGCQRFPITDWWTFDDRCIAGMDGKSALKFWSVWKPILQSIIEASPAEPTGYIAPEQPDAEPVAQEIVAK